MGGCFSGQKVLVSENAPVQSPVSPKSAAPTTENVVENPKEAPLVDVTETKEEEVKKEAEVVPKAVEDVSNVKEEAKVAEDETTAVTGTEDKTNAATVVV